MQKQSVRIGFGKWWCVLVCVILTASMMGSRVYAQEEGAWTGNVNLFIGQKWLDKRDWEPLEEQFELGVQFDIRPVKWPVNLVLDLSYSWDDGSVYDPWLGSLGLESKTIEINPGVRWVYEKLAYIRPFIGAGPAFVFADFEGSALGITVSDDDWALGLWFQGGVYFTLAEHLNLGVQAKYSWAEVDLLVWMLMQVGGISGH